MVQGWLRPISSILAVVFALTSVMPAQAQSVSLLPRPGEMVDLSSVFRPCLMKGVRYYPEDPFRYDFLIHAGDAGLTGEALTQESAKLIKYLLASLTTPAEDLWVNLSPYEGDRIIPDAFGATEMGRDLLAQDYILKQVTSSLLYPEKTMGKKFWERVYARSQELYGTTDVPVETFHKVWIVPDIADIVVRNNTAYVVRARLKLMLEKDYVAARRQEEDAGRRVSDPGHSALAEPREAAGHDISTDIMREVILPELEREVNEGRNFATVRQVYSSLVLATWLKRKIAGQANAVAAGYVDHKKTLGVEHGEKAVTRHIWERYVQAFKSGVFDLIKEEAREDNGEILPRRYFSGGANLRVDPREVSPAMMADSDLDAVATVVKTRMESVGGQDGPAVIAPDEASRIFHGLEISLDESGEIAVSGGDSDLVGAGGNTTIIRLPRRLPGYAVRIPRSAHMPDAYAGFDIGERAGVSSRIIDSRKVKFPDGYRDVLLVDYIRSVEGNQNLAELIRSRALAPEEQAAVVAFMKKMWEQALSMQDLKLENLVLGYRPGSDVLEVVVIDPELLEVWRGPRRKLADHLELLITREDWSSNLSCQEEIRAFLAFQREQNPPWWAKALALAWHPRPAPDKGRVRSDRAMKREPPLRAGSVWRDEPVGIRDLWKDNFEKYSLVEASLQERGVHSGDFERQENSLQKNHGRGELPVYLHKATGIKIVEKPISPESLVVVKKLAQRKRPAVVPLFFDGRTDRYFEVFLPGYMIMNTAYIGPWRYVVAADKSRIRKIYEDSTRGFLDEDGSWENNVMVDVGKLPNGETGVVDVKLIDFEFLAKPDEGIFAPDPLLQRRPVERAMKSEAGRFILRTRPSDRVVVFGLLTRVLRIHNVMRQVFLKDPRDLVHRSGGRIEIDGELQEEIRVWRERMLQAPQAARMMREVLEKYFARYPRNLLVQALFQAVSTSSAGQEGDVNIMEFLLFLEGLSDQAENNFDEISRRFLRLRANLVPFLNGLMMADDVTLVQRDDKGASVDVDTILRQGYIYDEVVHVTDGDRAFMDEVAHVLQGYDEILGRLTEGDGEKERITDQDLEVLDRLNNDLVDAGIGAYDAPQPGTLAYALFRKQVRERKFRKALIARIMEGHILLSDNKARRLGQQSLDITPWDIWTTTLLIKSTMEHYRRGDVMDGRLFDQLREEKKRISQVLRLLQSIRQRGFVGFLLKPAHNPLALSAEKGKILDMDVYLSRVEGLFKKQLSRHVLISEMQAVAPAVQGVDPAKALSDGTSFVGADADKAGPDDGVTPGGIDLNTNDLKMNIEESAQTGGVALSGNRMGAREEIRGLKPVILGVEAVSSVRMLLDLSNVPGADS